MRKHYRSIFISDTHFGFRHNRSDLLNDFLKHHTCDNLYLVGDIVDVWELQRKFKWSLSDSLATRQILNKKRQGAKVFYLPGNHDGVLRGFLKHMDVEGVVLANELCHIGVDGKKYLVIHGDIFDSNTATWTILSKFGSRAYDWSIIVSTWINRLRSRWGYQDWSLASYLKQKVKAASKHISRYENHMVEYCVNGGYDGVICGHIHKPEIRTITSPLYGDERMARMSEYHAPIAYMNSGDWVESCTALIEENDGSFKIIEWKKTK